MRGDVAALLDTHPTPGDGLGGVINADLGKLGGCPQIGFNSNAPPHANPSGYRDTNTPANTEVLLCTPKVRLDLISQGCLLAYLLLDDRRSDAE